MASTISWSRAEEGRKAARSGRNIARTPVTLYRCPPFAAWISVNACTAIKLREKPAPGASRVPENVTAEGPVFAGLRALGRRLSPCLACPGVVALRERRKTPKPRRIET